MAPFTEPSSVWYLLWGLFLTSTRYIAWQTSHMDDPSVQKSDEQWAPSNHLPSSGVKWSKSRATGQLMLWSDVDRLVFWGSNRQQDRKLVAKPYLVSEEMWRMLHENLIKGQPHNRVIYDSAGVADGVECELFWQIDNLQRSSHPLASPHVTFSRGVTDQRREDDNSSCPNSSPSLNVDMHGEEHNQEDAITLKISDSVTQDHLKDYFPRSI